MKHGIYALTAVALLCAFWNDAHATNESQAAVLLLLIEPGARAAGLGESFVTIDDATASYFNPAGLAGQTQRELTMSHTNWLPALHPSDMYYEFIGYSQYVEGWGNLGVHAVFFYMGEQERRSETDQPGESFTSYDAVISVAYGARVLENTSAGVTMKLIQSHLADRGAGIEKGAGTGYGFAVDLGLVYRPPVRGLKLGLALHNMGPKIAYIDAEQADPLPLNIVVGGSYELMESEYSKVLVLLDLYKPLVQRENPSLQAVWSGWADEKGKREVEMFGRKVRLPREIAQIDLHTGIEYTYGSFLALRAGYSADFDGELKTPTFGFGLTYDWVRFDMAYLTARHTLLENNTRFSLTFTF
jgi:hypothetical protein